MFVEELVAGGEGEGGVQGVVDDALARLFDVELGAAGVQEELLRLLGAQTQSEAQAKQALASRMAFAGEDLVAVDGVQPAAAQQLRAAEAPALHELLQQLMQSRGLSRAELLRRSGLNAVYGYQILSGKRHPGRESLLCLCFGLGLGAEQTQKLLLHAGCAQLYIKKPRESIIYYALNAALPLPSCNQLLYEHGEAILG